MEFIDLRSQYEAIKDDINYRIQNVLNHGAYINGPEVTALEDKLSKFVGVKHTITCANGTDALEIVLRALGIGPNDVVFCPTFTFFATAEVISNLGAIPIFVDSDLETFNICPDDLEDKIRRTKKETDFNPKAIISVDLFGLPANYDRLERIAAQYDLLLVEDAAQGFGGSIRGKRAGSFGIAATTSFFPAKPLGCYGDGGAIFTNSDTINELARSLRSHGQGSHKYENIRIGYNSRLDTIQAAVLLAKLEVFEKELNSRDCAAKNYNKIYAEHFVVPTVPDGFRSAWAQYTIRCDNRTNTIKEFQKKGIPTNIYYPKCLHEQKAFQYVKDLQINLPRAINLSKSVLSLPMHGYL